MRFDSILIVVLSFFILVACNDDEGKNRSARNRVPSAIFADYRISGEEGKDRVTCLLQFYEEEGDGPTLLLENPAGVQIDGAPLAADSTPRTGAYYELQKDLKAFKGKHTITLTDEHGQQYKEEILFEPLVLKTSLPPTIPRDSLVLQVAGLLPGEKVRVLLTDIDFDTDDINRLQTAPNGKIVLTAEDLRRVAPGPVTLMLYKEAERKLKDRTAAGGRLSITYGLSREFELVD